MDAKPVNGKFQDRLFEVSNMVEKPRLEDAPSNLAIIGRYILTPGIFEALEHTPLGTGGGLQLTDAIRLLLQKEKVYGYRFECTRHDTRDKAGFLKAPEGFALNPPGLGNDLEN